MTEQTKSGWPKKAMNMPEIIEGVSSKYDNHGIYCIGFNTAIDLCHQAVVEGVDLKSIKNILWEAAREDEGYKEKELDLGEPIFISWDQLDDVAQAIQKHILKEILGDERKGNDKRTD